MSSGNIRRIRLSFEPIHPAIKLLVISPSRVRSQRGITLVFGRKLMYRGELLSLLTKPQ